MLIRLKAAKERRARKPQNINFFPVEEPNFF